MKKNLIKSRIIKTRVRSLLHGEKLPRKQVSKYVEITLASQSIFVRMKKNNGLDTCKDGGLLQREKM